MLKISLSKKSKTMVLETIKPIKQLESARSCSKSNLNYISETEIEIL